MLQVIIIKLTPVIQRVFCDSSIRGLMVLLWAPRSEFARHDPAMTELRALNVLTRAVDMVFPSASSAFQGGQGTAGEGCKAR